MTASEKLWVVKSWERIFLGFCVQGARGSGSLCCRPGWGSAPRGVQAKVLWLLHAHFSQFNNYREWA